MHLWGQRDSRAIRYLPCLWLIQEGAGFDLNIPDGTQNLPEAISEKKARSNS